jgi:hypothetical protein
MPVVGRFADCRLLATTPTDLLTTAYTDYCRLLFTGYWPFPQKVVRGYEVPLSLSSDSDEEVVPSPAWPCLDLPCLVRPYLDLPCPASPGLALPCLALPCLNLLCVAWRLALLCPSLALISLACLDQPGPAFGSSRSFHFLL